MDAIFRGFLLVGALASLGAGVRTPNFIVHAPTAEFAKQVGEAAEIYRRELAIEWLGTPLPGNWEQPCPITVVPGNMGAGGKTTFNFQNGEVYGWKMEVKGSEQRILDSVLPHEINHTIFASYFRRPLPRWADEGAASLIEHESERNQLRQIHSGVMGTRRKIALKTLLEIKQYPENQQELLTLYAEGHSLADFLIQRAGKREYVRLMAMAHERGWEESVKSLYGYKSVTQLEQDWDQWVMAGSQNLSIPKGSQIASRTQPSTKEPTIRAQSPDTGIKLGEPVHLTAPELPIPREKRDTREVASNSDDSPSRSRSNLQEPLLTVNTTTTDAAKVVRE
jgi:hypothetical protein